MIDLKSKFSILMANYNNGKYIEEAILSVINQTSKDWELIIIDDCSKDNSEKVIKKYLRDKRIKYFRNESNRGYIDTLRRLINKASYDIVGILDSDDVLEKTAIEKVLQAYQKHTDCGFVYTQYVYCDENLGHCVMGKSKMMKTGESNIFKDFVWAFRTFKIEEYKKTSGFEDYALYAEDKDLILKMEEVTKFHFINDVLYKYRAVSESQTRNKEKNLIGLTSHTLSKYKAYKRRIGTDLPNLTKKEISSQLLKTAPICLKIRQINLFIYLFLNAVRIYPLNFPAYFYFIYRMIKFIPYRLIKSFKKA